MTPKEALKGIKQAIAEHLHKQTGVNVEKHFKYLQNDTEISIVERALTPPTADEVIKALSEYYGRKVVFRDNAFWYKTIIFNNEIWVREVSLKDLSKDNRGDLITMIGKFCESLDGKK